MYRERDKKTEKFRELIIGFLKSKKGNEACFKEIIDFLKKKLGEEFRSGYGILDPEFEDDERVVRFNVLKSSKHFGKRKEGVRIWYSPKNLEA